MAVPHPHVDTAAQRPATGLDAGARTLILRVIEEILFHKRASVPPQAAIIRWFFENRYGNYPDYMNAVESVWGGTERFRLEHAVSEAQVNAEFPATLTMPSRTAGQEAGQLALLLSMPEPDFRLAVEKSLISLDSMDAAADRITRSATTAGSRGDLTRGPGLSGPAIRRSSAT